MKGKRRQDPNLMVAGREGGGDEEVRRELAQEGAGNKKKPEVFYVFAAPVPPNVDTTPATPQRKPVGLAVFGDSSVGTR
jgi:hypothetical protein